jgi:flagella basal body P-ring formation protein FlgA
MIFFLLLLNGLTAQAAEVRLLPELSTSSSVVRLGDIADLKEIAESERSQLAEIALFPAPKLGEVRRVTPQEVRETLNLFGISLEGMHISGATRIKGIAAKPVSETRVEEKQPPETSASFKDVTYPVTSAQAFVEREPEVASTAIDYCVSLLMKHFETQDQVQAVWKITPQFTPEQATQVMRMERPEISGGQAPFLGRQVFAVRDAMRPSQKAVFLKVDVVRQAQAVVARRRLEVGQIIGSDDIEIREVNSQAFPLQALKTESAAVGMEVARMIPEGQIVQSTMVRRVMLTRKGELVTVYSIASGLQVKATARALADAGLGDVITLQAADGSKRYQARVTGPQECMVFVDSPRISASSAAKKFE